MIKEVITDLEAKLDKQEQHLSYLRRQQTVTQKRYEKSISESILNQREQEQISSDLRSTTRTIAGLTINLAQKKKELEHDRTR